MSVLTHEANTWFCMGGSGLDRTGDFQKMCGSGLDRIQFLQIRTALGLKNFPVRSSLSHSRNSPWARFIVLLVPVFIFHGTGFLFFVVPVFIYFFKKFPNFCGQICGLGLIRARFTKILLSVVQPRDEHWTGFGLDWIRTMTNFVDFELDPDCKMLHKFRTRIGFGLS